MTLNRFRTSHVLTSLALLVTLAFILACGGAATPTSQAEAEATPASAAPVTSETSAPVAAPTPTTAAAIALGEAKYGGILPFHAFAFPPLRWDPHSGWPTAMFANPFYNSLIEYDPTTADFFDLRGDLAKSWELSEDGLTYTFALHDNATWHDGNPVTAEDVAYSMDRMVDKDQFRPLTLSTVGNFYKPGNARVIDEHTVAITTPFPTADIIATLAMDSSIMAPKHYSPALEAEFGRELPWDKSLGSGPFKPGKFIRDVSVDLEKNEDYWKERAPLPGRCQAPGHNRERVHHRRV